MISTQLLERAKFIRLKETEQEIETSRRQLREMARQTQQIKKGDEKYKSIYENAIVGIFRTDKEGRFIEANTTLARMHGFGSVEELLRNAADLGDIYAKPKNTKTISKTLREKGMARGLDGEIFSRDGHTRWVRMNVRAERDGKGDILYYEGTVEDITEKKWAEDKYQRIFMNATEGIFQITPEGRTIAANPALVRIHGFNSLEEFMENATDISTQLHVDVDTWYEYLEAMRTHGFVRDQLWKMYRKDGSIAWLSCNARVVHDENGRVLYHEGTIQDITDKKIMLDQILMQRDLALRLAQTGSVGEGMALILETAVKASGMESGGIWLKREGEKLELISSIGMTAKFEKMAGILAVGSRPWKRMMSEKVLFIVPTDESMPNIHKEGYKHAAVIPILHEGEVIACFNLFSRVKETRSRRSSASIFSQGNWAASS
ncbi:MAG: PAS domain S-box protein [Desulfatiglandales bacterium]